MVWGYCLDNLWVDHPKNKLSSKPFNFKIKFSVFLHDFQFGWCADHKNDI